MVGKLKKLDIQLYMYSSSFSCFEISPLSGAKEKERALSINLEVVDMLHAPSMIPKLNNSSQPKTEQTEQLVSGVVAAQQRARGAPSDGREAQEARHSAVPVFKFIQLF